jgi:hypothetical protein
MAAFALNAVVNSPIYKEWSKDVRREGYELYIEYGISGESKQENGQSTYKTCIERPFLLEPCAHCLKFLW